MPPYKSCLLLSELHEAQSRIGMHNRPDGTLVVGARGLLGDNMKALLLALPLVMAGCATTRVTGYTDPEFMGRTYKSTAVFANTDRLEDAAHLEEVTCRVFAAHGVTCAKMTELFPPTRAHTTEDVYSTLSQRGIESVLVLTMRGDNAQSHVAFLQSFGTATAYGEYSSAYGTTIPVRQTTRSSRSRAELLDCATRNIAWIGDANTEGRGRFGTSDSKFRGSLAKGTVVTLIRAGHFVVAK